MTVTTTWRFSKYIHSYIRRTDAGTKEVQRHVKSVLRHNVDEVCLLLGHHTT